MLNPTAVALTGFILWFLVLLVTIIVVRVVHTHRTGKPVNSYRSDGSDVSPFAQRLCAAHTNCYESFPFVGGILLLALATGNAAVTNGLALPLLGLRVAQSSVHVYSTAERAVKARASLFILQVLITGYLTVALLEALPA